MKYCLRNKVSAQYLKKADEILVTYRERSVIPDLAEKYSQAAIILEILPMEDWELEEIKQLSALSLGRLTLSVPNLKDPRLSQLEGIPYFWGYAVGSWYELDAVKAAGVSQIRIDTPLFFETDKLKNINLPLRLVPNVAHEGYLPHLDGVAGSWVRPEDISLYEGIFSTIEFHDCDASKEQALYRIYAEGQGWPGPLEDLITNIGTSGKVNRMLPRDFTEHRLNCHQRCKQGGNCQICYRHIRLADPEKIREYANR